jgi:Transglutaminase-like superfamily
VSLRSPAGALLLARMLAWRLALPLLKRALPLPRLARLAAGGPRRELPFTPAQVVSLSHRLFGARAAESSDCLERSLLTYRFLLRTGAAAELVCGVRRADGAVVGHAWVAVAGAPVDEPPEALAGYATLVAFDASGARV